MRHRANRTTHSIGRLFLKEERIIDVSSSFFSTESYNPPFFFFLSSSLILCNFHSSLFFFLLDFILTFLLFILGFGDLDFADLKLEGVKVGIGRVEEV